MSNEVEEEEYEYGGESYIPTKQSAFFQPCIRPESDFLPWGTRTLRGGKKTFSPCVLDRTGWENFYLSYPVDYDIRNNEKFNCHRSTYNRLMGVGAPVPEPTTSEMLRTGFFGPDPSGLVRPTFLNKIDKRPEPAYRLHLSDRTSLHHLRADGLEGVLPHGRTGDMSKAKSTTKRDFKWRSCCEKKPEMPLTTDRKVHHFARTDLHGRFVDKVVKFEDENPEEFFNTKLMKLKKAYWWPRNTITREALGGHLLYFHNDPCKENRRDIWPTGERDVVDCSKICMPEDRCCVMAHRPKEWNRFKKRHDHQKSYLDSRNPIRNYECWEEVPECCGGNPKNFPQNCDFAQVRASFPLSCAQNQ